MRIRLLAFASAGDAVGRDAVELELPDGSTVAELRRNLDERFPGLAPLWPRLAIAVDGDLTNADAPLRDGAEVALLPPVSGGRPEEQAPRPSGPVACLVDQAIDVEALVRAVEHPSCGAVLLFLGDVREANVHGSSEANATIKAAPTDASRHARRVTHLTYSAYRPMAEQRLRRIVTDLSGEGVDSVEGIDSAEGVKSAGGGGRVRTAIVHRLGDVPVGETSVAIAVASPHRAAAYEASRVALERLKAEVPIWKREHYAGGEAVWREEEMLQPSVQRGSRAPTA